MMREPLESFTIALDLQCRMEVGNTYARRIPGCADQTMSTQDLQRISMILRPLVILLYLVNCRIDTLLSAFNNEAVIYTTALDT